MWPIFTRPDVGVPALPTPDPPTGHNIESPPVPDEMLQWQMASDEADDELTRLRQHCVANGNIVDESAPTMP